MDIDVPLAPVPQTVCTQCPAWARVGSKYCSNACGVTAHAQRVKQEKAQQVGEWKKALFTRRCVVVWQDLLESKSKNSFTSAIEEEDFKTLGEVEQERLSALATIERIKREQEELEHEIQTHQVPANENGSDMSDEKGDRAGKTGHIDCPYCGVSPSGSALTLSHHFTACFQKFESSNPIYGLMPMVEGDVNTLIYCDHFDTKNGSYCKKLKASCSAHSGVIAKTVRPGTKAKPASETMELCGARIALPSSPLHDSVTPSSSSSHIDTLKVTYGRCRALRRECPRHFNWENVSRRQLELQLISHVQLAEALQQEAAGVKEKMILGRLSRGLKGNAQTIPHTKIDVNQSQHMDITSMPS